MEKRPMTKSQALASLFVAAALVVAAKAGAEAKPSFTELDRAGDGYVTLEDAQSHPGLARVFAEADANGDGRLDRTEFEAALAMLREEGKDDA
jgi:hypothetical protein